MMPNVATSQMHFLPRLRLERRCGSTIYVDGVTVTGASVLRCCVCDLQASLFRCSHWTTWAGRPSTVTPTWARLGTGLHGPLSSVRLEAWRRGLEDRALLMLLTPAQRAELSGRLVRNAANWSLDEALQTRKDAAELIGTRVCTSAEE